LAGSQEISALLVWLCLPAWLIALAIRLRREGGNGKQPATEVWLALAGEIVSG
jgi:hypothetical protein